MEDDEEWEKLCFNVEEELHALPADAYVDGVEDLSIPAVPPEPQTPPTSHTSFAHGPQAPLPGTEVRRKCRVSEESWAKGGARAAGLEEEAGRLDSLTLSLERALCKTLPSFCRVLDPVPEHSAPLDSPEAMQRARSAISSASSDAMRVVNTSKNKPVLGFGEVYADMRAVDAAVRGFHAGTFQSTKCFNGTSSANKYQFCCGTCPDTRKTFSCSCA